MAFVCVQGDTSFYFSTTHYPLDTVYNSFYRFLKQAKSTRGKAFKVVSERSKPQNRILILQHLTHTNAIFTNYHILVFILPTQGRKFHLLLISIAKIEM